MKYFKSILVVTALTITTSLFGQTTSESEEKPYIEITGTAEQEIVPDEIYIEIVITEKYENKEKVTIEMQEEILKASLKEIGIDLKNLYLSDANADYVKVKWKSKDVMTKKEYTLKVTNATTVGQVFQQLDKIDITDANIDKVNHSQIDSLRREVRIKAIKSAKSKAEYLLAAIGQHTGKVLIVREVAKNYSNTPLIANTQATMQHYDSTPKSDGIQFRKIKIESSIYVKFLIE